MGRTSHPASDLSKFLSLSINTAVLTSGLWKIILYDTINARTDINQFFSKECY